MKYLLMTLALSVMNCQLSIAATALAPGVPLSLAQQRAASISDVSYRLGFVVPAQRTDPVTFTDTVTFVLKGEATDVVLDFTGRLHTEQTVNGKNVGLSVENEHIVVPREMLHRGQNTIVLKGQSLDLALNRHEDYLYTLFVPANARTAFPCFDQPDLKALFHLSLDLPEGWTAIHSAQGDAHPLPTYLFSFTAGLFQESRQQVDGRWVRTLYRETDSAKVAQLPDIMKLVGQSIQWLELYTGIPYPFQDYGMVILPGYQFGGMEHPGAIQYRDRTLFLQPGATDDDRLRRQKLIAHETAHMWFGDMVTMKWFDDVWTKEVFANFLADKMGREAFPDIDHQLDYLKSTHLPAIQVDRTRGTHPIQQSLENLDRAGLLYGNIIYYKAPVMMQKLEAQMGVESLRRGLQTYLQRFAYANATWDELIAILDSVAPQCQLSQFSDVWVHQKGMPTMTVEDGVLHQSDPWGRGLMWPQKFTYRQYDGTGGHEDVPVDVRDSVVCLIRDTTDVGVLIPNIDGQCYGRFLLSSEQQDEMMALIDHGASLAPAERLSVCAMLYENWTMGNLDSEKLFSFILDMMPREENSLVFSQLVSYAGSVLAWMPPSVHFLAERRLWTLMQPGHLSDVHQRQLKRSMLTSLYGTELSDSLYQLWSRHDDPHLTEQNYTGLSYLLTIQHPFEWRHILDLQRDRLTNPDEQKEFDFVSRACTPDGKERLALFQELLEAENRTSEPWSRSMLALLCHPLRADESVRYIRPGLDALPQIQSTSGIFFPGDWLQALVGTQHSKSARNEVEEWLNENQGKLSSALRDKLFQTADRLLQRGGL